MENKGDTQTVAKPKGFVKNVCKEFLVKEDENLAHRLQNQEFHCHYDLNRKQNKSIRTDIPIAKTIQNKEYQEQLRRHKLLEQIEKEDALVAQEEQKRIMHELNKQNKLQELADEEYAKTLQKSLVAKHRPAQNSVNTPNGELDEMQYNNKEYFKKLQEQDYQIAKYLQEQEKRKSIQASASATAAAAAAASASSIKQPVESEDERLARMLQEEENLKYQRERVSAKNLHQIYNNQLNNTIGTNNQNSSSHKPLQRFSTISGPFIIDENYINPSNGINRTSTIGSTSLTSTPQPSPKASVISTTPRSNSNDDSKKIKKKFSFF